nr:MAG TPA: hypothetical protein [Caudoviricetes sp.]
MKENSDGNDTNVGSIGNSIEEDIILLKDFTEGNLKRDKLENYKGSYKMGYFYCKNIQQAIEHILSDYKRVLKELEELKDTNCLVKRYFKLKDTNTYLRKENEELNKKENKIYKEVQESLSFEKFLVAKKREPDLFNQGRFYISQIIYDILNNVENPEEIHKENKYIKYIDYIPVQKIKDKIEELKEQYNVRELDFIKTTQDIRKIIIQSLEELLEGKN